MNFDNITCRPIVIIANYRTSSTPLCLHLGKKYSIKSFSEPMINNERFDKFVAHYEKDKNNFVLKIIVDQIDDTPQYREIINRDCYKIRLFRKDIVSQIVSHYISVKTRKWHQTNIENIVPYSIRIVPSHIRSSIETIFNNNIKLNSLNIDFDYTLYSEDLPLLDETNHVVTTKPINYHDIYSAVSDLYLKEYQ